MRAQKLASGVPYSRNIGGLNHTQGPNRPLLGPLAGPRSTYDHHIFLERGEMSQVWLELECHDFAVWKSFTLLRNLEYVQHRVCGTRGRSISHTEKIGLLGASLAVVAPRCADNLLAVLSEHGLSSIFAVPHHEPTNANTKQSKASQNDPHNFSSTHA